MSNYTRLTAMITTSTVLMFGLMYLNSYQPGHVYFSETRMYMAIVMGATMALVMLAFMRGMYKNSRMNGGIVVGSRLHSRWLSGWCGVRQRLAMWRG